MQTRQGQVSCCKHRRSPSTMACVSSHGPSAVQLQAGQGLCASSCLLSEVYISS